ncbi:MAG: NosD domain-containing protein [Kiritimatiellae bacterium]|nr:NosD domain-containing protein [Kiritimatiellia bacterium]MDD5523276.1 NosD domain-containing protein [Kiritimatiellia bacterium]
MNTNEPDNLITRRQFMGTSAAAGAFAMKSGADNWTNVTDAAGLQSALDSLPKQGGAIHVPAGTYKFNKPVTKKLLEGQHLFIVGDGRGSVLTNTNTSGEPLLHISGVTGSSWPDLRITIRDIAFIGNYQSGDGLIVDYPNDTLVDTCFFLGHGGQAISLVPKGTNVTVRDCWMRDCKRGVRAENIHHLTLHGNQTRSMAKGQIQEEHIYLGWDCREVRIVNNHIAYGQDIAIILDGTAQHVIANNTIEGFKTAIKARGVCDKKPRDRCRDIAITSNYMHADIGVHLVGECRGFAITGNDFINNNEAAILIEQAAGAGKHSITGNMVRKSVYGGAFFPLSNSKPSQGGFHLGDAEDCIVSGNLLDGIDPGPAICAGPDGGRHVITSNRIILPKATALDIKAPGCLVEHNLTS